MYSPSLSTGALQRSPRQRGSAAPGRVSPGEGQDLGGLMSQVKVSLELLPEEVGACMGALSDKAEFCGIRAIESKRLGMHDNATYWEREAVRYRNARSAVVLYLAGA